MHDLFEIKTKSNDNTLLWTLTTFIELSWGTSPNRWSIKAYAAELAETINSASSNPMMRPPLKGASASVREGREGDHAVIVQDAEGKEVAQILLLNLRDGEDFYNWILKSFDDLWTMPGDFGSRAFAEKFPTPELRATKDIGYHHSKNGWFAYSGKESAWGKTKPEARANLLSKQKGVRRRKTNKKGRK